MTSRDKRQPVADVATVLNVLAEYDPRDPTTQKSVDRSVQAYRTFLDPVALKGARLGTAILLWQILD